MTRRAGIVLIALLAAGCGQTGELFLPGERPEPRPVPGTEAPAGTQAGDESTEEDDEETPAR